MGAKYLQNMGQSTRNSKLSSKLRSIHTQTMHLRRLNEESTALAEMLYSILDVPRFDDTDRVRVSDVACSMALEH